MLTEQQVLDELKDLKAFHPFVPYITKIANIYIHAQMDAGLVLSICITEAAQAAKSNTAEAFRIAFIELCNGYGAREGVAVPMPDPNDRMEMVLQVSPFNPLYATEVEKLRSLRTDKSNESGKRLARGVLLLENCFEWVSSGSRQPGTEYQSGPEFGIITSATHKLRDDGRLEELSTKQKNDFAKWLVKPNAPKPGPKSRMNCWESVFFCACEAQLITKTELEEIHEDAARAYKLANNNSHNILLGDDKYMDTLKQALNYFESVQYRPEAGIIPREGDIVFWGGNLDHVAISLGPIKLYDGTFNGVMSLWHAPMRRNTIEELNNYVQEKVTFVPCPF